MVETWNLTRRPVDLNVGFSNEAAAQAITSHLIESGRHHIGVITGSLAHNDRAQGRLAGYEVAVRDAGLDSSRLPGALPLPDARMSNLDVLLYRCAPPRDSRDCVGWNICIGIDDDDVGAFAFRDLAPVIQPCSLGRCA